MEPTVSVLPDRDGQRIVRCSGEFDAETLAPLKAAVDTAADLDIDRLILDVRRVAFADSSLLNLLLAARREHDVRLVGLRPRGRHPHRPGRLGTVSRIMCGAR